MVLIFKLYELLSSKYLTKLIKGASIIGCSFYIYTARAQVPYHLERFGLSLGTYESGINIVNTKDGNFHILTGSIDFIGDNWRYLSYKLDSQLNLDFFNLLDGDSVGYNIGYRSSSFFDAERGQVITSGFDFLNEDGVLYVQDITEPSTYSITSFTKSGYNSFRQGKLFQSGYLSIGYSNVNNNGQIWLVKNDFNGSVLWEKEYGTSYYEDGRAIENSHDGSLFLLGTSRGYGSVPGFYNQALLIKTDSLGNELWRTNWGGYFDDCANNLAATPDGGVIACGCISEENSSGNWQVAQGYIRKMDAEGNLVWDKTYDWQSVLLGGSVHSFSVVRVLDNETIIVVGSGAKLNVDSTASRRVPWAVIFDKNGNVLMERAYTSLVGGYSSAEFQDIQPTADGGFIAGGTYYPSQGDTGNQDAFIVKLDERGCEFAECQPPLAVEELLVGSNELVVWPNPTSGLLHIETESQMESIKVYDQLGSLVGSWQYSVGSTLESIDVSIFESGLYFLVVKTDKGVETNKVIIER